MWVNRGRWEQLKALLDEYRRRDEAHAAVIRRLEHELTRERRSAIDTARTAWEARARLSAANAYTDLFRLRVNALEEERAALLALALPSLRMAIPKVEHSAAHHTPGLEFEDMGDAAARLDGFADDLPLPPDPSVPVPATIAGVPEVPAAPDVPGFDPFEHRDDRDP